MTGARSPLAVLTSEHRVSSFWHALTAAERASVAAAAHPQRFRHGSPVLGCGPHRVAAVIHSGQVRAHTPAGVTLRWAGDIVGEGALLRNPGQTEFVVADTAVHALLLGPREWSRVVFLHPRVASVLGAVMAGRSDQLAPARRPDTCSRVAAVLLGNASEYGGRARVHIGSQARLASVLAVSRETVVRALHRLRIKGVITTHRGLVVIHDVERLRSIAS